MSRISRMSQPKEKFTMDVYQIVTDRIINLLEQGTVPWRKPWNTANGMPRNLCSNKEYRGVNLFLLGCQQYSSPYWLTYKQATEKKGNVRKGEKSSLVVFWIVTVPLMIVRMQLLYQVRFRYYGITTCSTWSSVKVYQLHHPILPPISSLQLREQNRS